MQYGFLNIYKEKGQTSFDVIRDLRRITGIKRIGHTGTLDPMAEGVLVVALGEATKLIEFLMKDGKEYQAEILLGKKSDTYDAEGKIQEVSSQQPTLEKITKVLKKFKGEIEQIPPKFSALKIEGKRAYEMARKGRDFEMKPRKINIYNIVIHEYSYPILKVDINCSSGTYIRSIANDLGDSLGTGALLDGLIRTKSGNFLVNDSVKIFEINEKGYENYLLPLEAVSLNHNSIEISEEEYQKLNYGQFINLKNAEGEILCAFLKNKLVGIIEKTKNGQFKYKKKINI